MWARIFPQAAGARQSPVDIDTNIASGDSLLEQRKLTSSYGAQENLQLINSGQGWKVQAPQPDSCK
jgi:carbonic anhydrase